MTTEHLAVTSRRSGSTVEVVADGELDLASAPALVEHAQEHLGEGDVKVVLDLSGVSFIDSSGVRALLTIADQQRERVQIIPSAACRRVFEISGVADCLPLTGSAADA